MTLTNLLKEFQDQSSCSDEDVKFIADNFSAEDIQEIIDYLDNLPPSHSISSLDDNNHPFVGEDASFAVIRKDILVHKLIAILEDWKNEDNIQVWSNIVAKYPSIVKKCSTIKDDRVIEHICNPMLKHPLGEALVAITNYKYCSVATDIVNTCIEDDDLYDLFTYIFNDQPESYWIMGDIILWTV